MNTLQDYLSTFQTTNETARETCSRLWKSISLHVQEKKLTSSGIFDLTKRQQILNELTFRPAILVHLALEAQKLGHSMNTFVEIGTAQGMQSIIFSEVFPQAKVYTCDIKDDRCQEFVSHQNLNFVLGDSLILGKKLYEEQKKVDFCWVDGSHDSYAVLDDFLSLLPHTHCDTIWAFDDYDERFGCFKDLNLILRHFKESLVLELGSTASGNPNRIIITRGLV